MSNRLRLTKVQEMISVEIKNGLNVDQISKKYSIIPAYIEREIKKIEDKKKDV